MPFDPNDHYRNRERFPAQELEKYFGMEVAWSLDGKHIVASGADAAAVGAAVLKSGLRSDDVVLAYVPFPDEAVFGGAFLFEEDA